MVHKKSIGFCINSRHLENHPIWFLRCIREVEKSNSFRIGKFVIVNEIADSQTQLAKRKRVPLASLSPVVIGWRLFRRIEFELYRRSLRGSESHCDITALKNYLNEYGTINISVKRRGIYAFAETSDEVEREHYEFLFRWVSSGIIKGTLLTLGAKRGILSLHHGDINRFRGTTGFWEWLSGEQMVTCSLQILSSELDGGTIVDEKKIPLDGYGWNQAMDEVKRLSHLALRDFLHRYESLGFDISKAISHIRRRLLYDQPIFKEPKSLRFLLLAIVKLAGQILCRNSSIYATDKRKEWSILVASAEKSAITSFSQLSAQKGRWYADPFLANVDGERYLLFEDCDAKTNMARISYCKLPPAHEIASISKRKRLDLLALPLLDTGSHLSYPYTFSHNQICYLIPESHSVKKVSLYMVQKQKNSSCLEAIYIRDLLYDIDAVDSSIVYLTGMFFLFTTVRREGMGDYSSDLSIYYSDDLLDGTFISHPLNPVISNPCSSRSGGRIWLDGNKMFRAAQSYIPTASNHIEFQEIQVSTEAFSYKVIDRIYPDWNDRVAKCHNLDFDSEYKTIDQFK